VKKENKINLLLGSHAHVPSGAADREFEYVYVNKMRPFITNLYRYPNIQAVLHYSGVLLYWVERTHPEIFMLIEDMVSKKQAEILSGGFYEPMFPLIPLQDRIGQIELLTTYLRKHFGKRPLGCWIPGMVWEQNLASSFSASEMSYTFLSQDQFIQAGIEGEELYFPCITEDQGKIIKIFPVNLNLEKELEEKSFSHVFITLKKKIEDEYINIKDKVICVFQEKIPCAKNESPDTAWHRFFEEISLCEEFVETVLPAKILKLQKLYKKVCFQNSSSFQNGFSPRRFIIEHCEANGIYSKMIFINVLINQLKGDKSRKQNAREELWKAQDSILFSPGKEQIKNEIRKAAYSSLLRAEQLSREKGKFTSSIIQYDFDFNGIPEYLVHDEILNCYIQLNGAGIFELDYLPKEWNYLDCGSVYSKKNGCEKITAFADVILSPQSKAEDIMENYPENTRLLFNEQFEALEQDRSGKICFHLAPASSNTPFGSLEINKSYMLKKNILSVSYTIKNTGKENIEFCFIPQINFSFTGTGLEFVRFYTVESDGKDTPLEKLIDNTGTIKILDIKNEVQILLSSSTLFSGNLASAFKDGFYQTSRILPLFSISLESSKSWTNDFSIKFSH
jgi:hypothetical protein